MTQPSKWIQGHRSVLAILVNDAGNWFPRAPSGACRKVTMPTQNSPLKNRDGESTTQRFGYRRATLVDFMTESLVVCPRCSLCATVTSAAPAGTKSFVPRRLNCSHCGLTRREEKRGLIRGWNDAPEDGFFHLSLWLQSDYCGHVLWAHNAGHLRFLKAYVGAELRERRRDPEHGWCNAGLASRLPKWMQLAKHRTAIIRAIGKLEQRLANAGFEAHEPNRASRRQTSKPPPRKP